VPSVTKDRLSGLMKIIPADNIAAQLVKDFKGDIKTSDFGFVYRIYKTPPKITPDRFIDGKIHGFRAKVPFYPASVVKVFFMVALLKCVQEKTITLDKEDKRALKNMIRISSNDATSYLLTRITDTNTGPALSSLEMNTWWKKRSKVQDYFDSYMWPEFNSIKLFHSTFEESPYGRERIARDLHGTNILTPVAGASLLHAIATGQIIDTHYSEQMMELLSRDWERDPKRPEKLEHDQVRGFITEAAPEKFKVWSKAGSTSRTRHDLVYVESPAGKAMTIAAFSQGKVCAANKLFLPALGRKLLKNID